MSEMPEPEQIKLENFCEGAAVVAFDQALKEVLTSIMDLNRSATASRKINFTFTLKPREDRLRVDTQFGYTVSVPPMASSNSPLFVGKTDAEELVALTADPRQMRIFNTPKPREAPPVIKFKTASEGK